MTHNKLVLLIVKPGSDKDDSACELAVMKSGLILLCFPNNIMYSTKVGTLIKQIFC